MVTKAKAKPIIVWNKKASLYFKKAYLYIKQDSPSNADKVRDGIIKIIESLPAKSDKYPPDKFRKNNNGQYRAFEKFSYRWSENEIRILRIRHVKQEPKEY